MYQFPHAIGIAGAHGNTMIRIINKSFRLEDKTILDYGSANGYLIDALLKKTKQTKVGGYDYSETAVNITNDKFRYDQRFIGAFSPKNISEANEKFDVILATEVFEHLTDNNINEAFRVIRLALKDDGCLIVTVPNNEDLDLHKVFCPSCGSIFHPVQHQRSFNVHSLENFIEHNGFRVKKIKRTSFIQGRSFFQISKKLFLKLYPEKNTNILGVFIKQPRVLSFL